MAISRHVRMISGSTERVKSRRFRTVRVVVSSLSTVARSMGRSPLHHSQRELAWQWILRKGYGSIVHARRKGHNREEDLATRMRILHQESMIRLPMYADDHYWDMTRDRLRFRASNVSRSVSPE